MGNITPGNAEKSSCHKTELGYNWFPMCTENIYYSTIFILYIIFEARRAYYSLNVKHTFAGVYHFCVLSHVSNHLYLEFFQRLSRLECFD